MTYTTIAEQLGDKGLCICPDFISKSMCNDTRKDLDQVQASGGFHRAGVGLGDENQIENSVRSDETYWLERNSENLAQTAIWNEIDLLKQAFNRTLYLGLNDFEGHYAAYPEGGFYKRHLDCFHHNNDRVVTMIIYLNKNWIEADGGKLRIFNKDTFQDIRPLGGTMVCFMSRETEHEVLLSHSARHSFAGWFKNVHSQV
jgi:SM-20-related protein